MSSPHPRIADIAESILLVGDRAVMRRGVGISRSGVAGGEGSELPARRVQVSYIRACVSPGKSCFLFFSLFDLKRVNDIALTWEFYFSFFPIGMVWPCESCFSCMDVC